MKHVIFPISFSLFLLLNACNSQSKKHEAATVTLADANGNGTQQEIISDQQSPLQQPTVVTDSGGARVITTPQVQQDWDKKIIKNGSLKLEVKEFKKSGDAIRQSIKKSGGYISQEEQNLVDEKSETTLTIKVPVAQFEDLMNELSGLSAKVIERKISTDDVTTEFIDTKSRLEAKKQMRLKYLDFLKQSKNMDEVLQVQKEINGIQEEIEAAMGRIGYIYQQAAFSTISLTFYEPSANFKPIDESPTFLKRASQAFSTGMQWLGNLLVGLISVWPLLLILVIGFLVFKNRISFNSGKRTAPNHNSH